MKRTFLRVVSMCLAVLMLVGAANLSVFAAQIDTGNDTQTLQSTVQAGVAKNGAVTVKTDGQIVAEKYSDKLSQLEKNILNTGALLGETYQITTPPDTCVTIDAETKTVTAENHVITPDVYSWVPVTATAVFAGGEVTKDFNGGKTVQFTAAEITADQYSIQVVYELKVTIDEYTQKALLNAPVTLAGAVVNMNIISGLTANLDTMATYIADLYDMTQYGSGAQVGSSKVVIEKGSAAEAAIVALYNDAKKVGNDLTTFDLCQAMLGYQESGVLQVEFVLEEGKIVHSLFDAMYANIGALVAQDSALRKIQSNLEFAADLGMDVIGYLDMLNLALNILDDMYGVMQTVDATYWSAYSNSPVKGTATDAEMAQLNAAVLAAVDGKALKDGVSFHDDITLANPIQIGTYTVTKGVDQYKVIVDVVAQVYKNSNATTTIAGVTGYQLVLDKNLTPDQIKAAIVAAGILDASVAAWDDFFGFEVAGAYEIVYSELPDALTEDVTCTVTFVPQNIYTIDYDYAADETVAYGYTFELPKHDDATKSYIYTVNGEKIFQGNKYRVTSDITVSREEGKSLEVVTIPAFVADSYIPGASLTVKDQSILQAGGLICGTIAYAKPDNTDVTIEVEATDLLTNAYSVSATAYPTVVLVNGAAVDAVWQPTEVWVGDAKVADFIGTAASFTYATEVSKVKVQYDLVIDEISISEVEDWAELPYQLAKDAATQASRLFTAVDLVASDGFNKANNLASSLAAIINAGNYAQKTKDAANKLNDECLNEKGKLKLADLLADYTGKSRSAMLANYYSGNNSEELNAQIVVLAEVFGDLSDDAAFLDYVDGIQAGTSSMFIEYKDKIANIRVPDVNENINRNATMLELTALADALLAEGNTTENVNVTTALTHRVAIEGVASNLVMINLSVTAAGKTFKDSMTFGKGETFTQDDIDAISDKLNALKAQATQNLDLKYYNVAEAELPAVGEKVADYSTLSTVYTPKTYTVVVDGVSSEITYNSTAMFVQLPRPSEGIVYRYTVGTKTYDIGYGQAPYELQITPADLDTLFVGGTLTITSVVVDTVREEFVNFVKSMNAAFKAGKMDAQLIMAADEADYSLVLRVGPNLAEAEMGSMMTDLMEAMTTYSSIKLQGSTFFEGVSINMQAIVDMMAYSGFSFDTVCNIIDDKGNVKNDAELAKLTGVKNIGGKVITTKLGLGEVKTVDMYITLAGANDQLLAVRDALQTVKGYVNLSCADGVYNIHLNMPDKLYPYYMSAMLLLDKTHFEDIQGDISVEGMINYYKDMVTSLTGDPNFTVETLENTAAEAGRKIDLSTYASTFELARSMVNYLLINVQAETKDIPAEEQNERYAATVTCPVGGLFNKLPENFSMLTSFITEAQAGGTIVFDINVTVEDRKIDYDAMIFDNSESGLGKFYYTTDLAGALAGLGNNSVVVLISDAKLSGDVVIPNNVFINLNGFKLEGNMSTSARVTISDSTLHTEAKGVGEVYGKLSGNFIITGGWYEQDVTSMLKGGYVQENGYVSNIYYTIEEDAEGNISINIPATILSTRTIPEIKALAIDIAMDIAFNVYNAASLEIDGKGIYSFATDDLISLATMSGREIAEVLVDMVELENIKELALSIYRQMMDFGGIADNIKADGVIVDYDMITRGWAFSFGVTDENTVAVDLVPGEVEAHGFSIVVTGTDEEKALLAGLFEEMGKTLVIDPTISRFSISYNGGLNVDIDSALDVSIDLSHNNNYAVLLIAAVADANNDADLKEILAQYLADKDNKETTAAMAAALDTTTLAEFIAGLKHLKAVGCEAMLKNLGIESDELMKLEAIYDDLVYVAGVILNRLDVTGGAQMLSGHKTGEFASYSFGPKTVDKYGVEFTMSLSLVLMSEGTTENDDPDQPDDPVDPTPSVPTVPSVPPVIKDFDLKESETASDKILGVDIQKNGSTSYLFLDMDVDGMTAEELIASLNITTSGIRVQTNVTVTNTKTVDGKEIITTGSVLTVSATNSAGRATQEYIIIIDGDVNCDGYVNSADAIYLAWHYCDVTELSELAVMAATGHCADADVHADDAINVIFKYLYWKAGNDRYVSKFGS